MLRLFRGMHIDAVIACVHLDGTRNRWMTDRRIGGWEALGVQVH